MTTTFDTRTLRWSGIKLLILLSSIVGCDGGGGISAPAEINRVTAELTEKFNSNTLVREIVEIGETHVRIDFEDSSSVLTLSKVIEQISEDVNLWMLKIEFVDGSSLSVGLVGEQIEFEVHELGDEASVFPLLRSVSFELPHQGVVRYEVQGRNGRSSDISKTSAELNNGGHEVRVLGLYSGWENDVSFEYLSSTGVLRSKVQLSVPTLELAHPVPKYDWRQANNQTSQRFYLHGHRSPGTCGNQVYIFDQFGDVRWLTKARSNYAVQQISSGEILFVTDGTDAFSIIALDGSRRDTYYLPEPFKNIHHDVAEVSPSEFLLTVNDSRKSTIEDVVVLFDTEVGEITRVWDLEDILPKSYELIFDEEDWFHMNAIDFDSRDSSLVLSGQRFGLVKVTWDNELVWMISDQRRLEEFTSDDRYSPYIFQSYDSDYFTWGQHDVEVDETSGEIFVFDNGLGRDYSNESEFSRAVIFEVDEETKTFGVLSQFGSNYPEHFAPIISGLDFTANHVLVNFGSLGYYFNYINNTNWIDRQTVRRLGVEYGAALMEFSRTDGSVVTEATISCLDNPSTMMNNPSTTMDNGIYRIEYVNLIE